MQQAVATATKHTAGPWEVRKISERLYGVDDNTGTAVADLHSIQGRHVSHNAKLVAAAPEMLAALIAIVEYEANPDFTLWAKRIDAARAAIAKATGVA